MLDDLYSVILEFLSLWNILEENQLVLSVSKQVTKNDAKIFFKKNKPYMDSPANVNLSEKFGIKLSEINVDDLNLPILFNKRHFYKKDDKEYSNVRLSIDEDVLVIAESHIDKKMLVLPGLQTYVDNNFMTRAEMKYQEEKSRAKTATRISFISVLVALGSIGFSYMMTINNTNFWEENEAVKLEKAEEINNLLLDMDEKLMEINNEMNDLIVMRTS